MNLSGTLVFDFDSTLSSGESLVQLIELSKSSSSEEVLAQVRHLTELGNSGRLSLAESIRRRLALCPPTVEALTHYHAEDRLTVGIAEMFRQFQQEFPCVKICVISGGPKICVAPQVARLGITNEDVHALDLDIQSMSIRDDDPVLQGKTYVLQRLIDLGTLNQRPIVIVGDSMADMMPRRNGVADYAIGFGMHVARDVVRQTSDQFATTVQELFQYIRSSLTQSV